MSVTEFSEGQPFSYVTVYKLIKCDGAFSSDTLIEVSTATGGEVSVAALVEAIEAKRKEGQAA